MIRILHAADLHLDSPFDALSEEKAALRRREPVSYTHLDVYKRQVEILLINMAT